MMVNDFFPDKRITANAAIPGAVAKAQMVSPLFIACIRQRYQECGYACVYIMR